MAFSDNWRIPTGAQAPRWSNNILWVKYGVLLWDDANVEELARTHDGAIVI